jgi:uncharacterized protein with GYD domain
MATFVMFGKYNQQSIKDISAERTKDAIAVIEKNGGEVISGYALLGDTDLVLIVNFPNIGQAMKTSVALSKLLGIGFATSPAVAFEEFDKLIV